MRRYLSLFIFPQSEADKRASLIAATGRCNVILFLFMWFLVFAVDSSFAAFPSSMYGYPSSDPADLLRSGHSGGPWKAVCAAIQSTSGGKCVSQSLFPDCRLVPGLGHGSMAAQDLGATPQKVLAIGAIRANPSPARLSVAFFKIFFTSVRDAGVFLIRSPYAYNDWRTGCTSPRSLETYVSIPSAAYDVDAASSSTYVFRHSRYYLLGEPTYLKLVQSAVCWIILPKLSGE